MCSVIIIFYATGEVCLVTVERPILGLYVFHESIIREFAPHVSITTYVVYGGCSISSRNENLLVVIQTKLRHSLQVCFSG